MLEYGWASSFIFLAPYYHWSIAAGYWNYTTYVVFEATLAAPLLGYLREKKNLPVGIFVILGGVMIGFAYFALTHASHIWIAYVGYAASGGLGSGFAYAAGVNGVQKWFPEKKGWRTGLVNGAWAYGDFPFIIWWAYGGLGYPGLTANNYCTNIAPMLLITGGIIMVIQIVAGILMKDPPKGWWPGYIDPITWRKQRLTSRISA